MSEVVFQVRQGMFLTYFLKFIKLFGKKQYFKLFILVLMSVGAGFLEFLGIMLVYPFIMLVLTPNSAQSILNHQFFRSHNIAMSYYQLVFLVGFLIIFAFIFKNIFMIINNYCQIFVLKRWNNKIKLYFMEKYLFTTYNDRLKLPPCYLFYQLQPVIDIAFNSFVSRVLVLFTNLIVASSILFLLIIKFKVWAVVTGVFFLLSGYLQNKFFKNVGRTLVAKKLEHMQNEHKYLYSAISSIKDIKIFAKEQHFFDMFKQQAQSIISIDAKTDFYAAIPPYVVEISIIISIVIISFGIVAMGQTSSNSVIASYAMLAAAIFRLAPIFNRIQSCMNSINSNKAPMQMVFDAYNSYSALNDTKAYSTDERMSLNQAIKAINIGFKYNEKFILRNINFEIKRGEFVGIIGASGIGKTTLADMLMGLLSSCEGEILVDGVPLKLENTSAWINSVGYVPQSVSTFPVSILENIAWGIAREDVDFALVEEVLEKSQLVDYVKSLDDGLNTLLTGEISNMSQGQKQRIGIARALYKKPSVIFLDEITSALDVETENRITETLNGLKGEKTILAIAHRLSTLKHCDKILYIKSPTELYSGTFDELSKEHSEFSNIISLSNTHI